MASRDIWINMHSCVFQRPQITLVHRTRAILRSLKNSLVHVIYIQIALETMLLPILIKTKQKVYRTHFFCNNSRKIKQYKEYSNRLNKLKSMCKIYSSMCISSFYSSI
jgi:hypothetical protein